MNTFYLIGLVGNIGSGKSTVRQMLEQLGAYTIDADALAHVTMQRGTPTWCAIVNAFGPDVLKFNGRIDRRKLGARVFADADALQKLESIVHPAVRALIIDLLNQNTKPIVVIEAIKLVEAGMYEWCDALWAVNCKPEVQIQRVMQTRQMSETDARARLAAQGSFEDKLRLADVIIDNSDSLDHTRAQVEKAWRAIQPATARDKSEWLHGLPIAESVSAPATPRTKEMEVRRLRRNDLGAFGAAIVRREKLTKPLSREELLKRFGERGYRIAIIDSHIVALAAWEAENLVATVREVWAESADDAAQALPRLFALIEKEARELLCEVAILLLEPNTPEFIIAQAQAAGYAAQQFDALHKLWKQAVQDRIQPGDQLFSKRLREEVITKPF